MTKAKSWILNQEDENASGSRGLNVLHCTAELMVSSAVHGADAERLGVLRKVLPSSELGASLLRITAVNISVSPSSAHFAYIDPRLFFHILPTRQDAGSPFEASGKR